jgi:nicotinamidase-related amidase
MLIQHEDCCLVVIDIQERLVPAVASPEQVIAHAGILIQAAVRLSVPIVVSEQYPRGLGRTVDAVKRELPASAAIIEKMTFSALADDAFAKHFRALARRQVVLIGLEAHVCVLQTVEQLLAVGSEVFVVADATASRAPISHQTAMRRLEQAGAVVVTTEMVVFEWLRRAGTPEFKELSALLK